MKMAEDSVNVVDKLNAYRELMTVKEYVFPKAVLEDIFYFTIKQPQSWIKSKSNMPAFMLLCKVLMEDHHEQCLFDIARASPHFVRKLLQLAWPRSTKEILRRKLKKIDRVVPLSPIASVESDIRQHLNAIDCHTLLNDLGKQENSQSIHKLTEDISNLMIFQYKPEVSYNTLERLLSLAEEAGKLTADIKRCISSMSVNLLVNLVTAKQWKWSHEVYKLIMQYDLPYLATPVYKQWDCSPAKKILAFVEVCLMSGNFEHAVSLLVDHNMFAVDNKSWSLASKNLDLELRNNIVTALINVTVKSDLSLAAALLAQVLKQQTTLDKPTGVVKSYELVLLELLAKSDELTALALFKEATLYHGAPMVYDLHLLRALVTVCVNNNEIDMAARLIRKGQLCGAYPKSNNVVSCGIMVINSNYTWQEMKMLVQNVLDEIRKYMVSNKTDDVSFGLHFTIVEVAKEIWDRLPKELSAINTSVLDARCRLVCVLRSEFNRPLYEHNFREDPQRRECVVTVPKSWLNEYFRAYRLPPSPRVPDCTKPGGLEDFGTHKRKFDDVCEKQGSQEKRQRDEKIKDCGEILNRIKLRGYMSYEARTKIPRPEDYMSCSSTALM